MTEQDPTFRSQSVDDEVILAESVDSRTDSAPTRTRTATPRRKILVPVMLLLATCLSTFLTGMSNWMPERLIEYMITGNWMPLRENVITHGVAGLIYMAAVVGILLSHEMGHFLMTIRYRVPSTLPFFIPMPLVLFGTMGAVIAMDGRRANRKEIFDIGIAGPLAGLVIAVPVLLLGVAQADFTLPEQGLLRFDIPIFIQWMLDLMQPRGYQGQTEIWLGQMTPLLMAGWFGLLITGLNMAPVGQLDGGHVVYTLFGQRGRWVSRAFVFVAIAFITLTGTYMWAVMLMLVILVVGVDHPPTSDDSVPIGPVRYALGVASLAIPILCLPPGGIVVVT